MKITIKRFISLENEGQNVNQNFDLRSPFEPFELKIENKLKIGILMSQTMLEQNFKTTQNQLRKSKKKYFSRQYSQTMGASIGKSTTFYLIL